MKDLWSEPFLELTEEASGKLVSVTSDANNLYLRMPEALEVDFVLGNLVAEGMSEKKARETDCYWVPRNRFGCKVC